MNILENLRKRQIFNDITNEEKFNNLPKGAGVYIGFDPTAESLHVGNYIQIAMLLRFKKAGYKAVAVLGGATGMIGDPSGKSEERNLLSNDDLLVNKKFIKEQLQSFGLEVVDNYDFYKDINVLDFLRNAGKLININYMLAKDVVASRLDTGISFTEFTYQLIQGWDFKCLYEDHGVNIQVGGSDQWGNITTGIEVIRKTQGDGHKSVGITTKLLLTKSGKKFGKSAGNAIWIDKNKTTPFQLYQYFLNTSDDDLKTMFNWLTFLDISTIEKIIEEHNSDPKERIGQRKLAFEMVKDIHSEEEAKTAKILTSVLFGSGNVAELTENQIAQLDGGIPTFTNVNGRLIEVLTNIKAAQSFREAKQFLDNRAIEVNGKIITDQDFEIVNDKSTLIKRGKKNYYLIKR